MSAESHARMNAALLPPGKAWERATETDSVLYKVLLAIADEWERVSGRASDLVTESDPRTADEMLPSWETALGLPDDAIEEIPATDADRRLAITQKLVSRGGQNEAFYIQLAASIGYTITIDFYQVARSGRARSGDRCYTDAWAYAWLVNLPIGDADAGFVAGSRAGERVGTHGQLGIEAVIRRAAPAHTTVLFSYAE